MAALLTMCVAGAATIGRFHDSFLVASSAAGPWRFHRSGLALFADALTHQLDGPSKPVPLYEAMGKLRLHASNEMDDWLGFRSHFLPIQEILRTQLPARSVFGVTIHEQTPRGPHQLA
jgi:hypothetical protein